jgi:ABC-type transporter lipoprotein component MlaA
VNNILYLLYSTHIEYGGKLIHGLFSSREKVLEAVELIKNSSDEYNYWREIKIIPYSDGAIEYG